ncbi:MAG: alpha/beta fold hydrolase [Bacteroidota bacterium]
MLHYKIINPEKNQRTVVFLHGFLESSTMWEILNLSQFNFRAILIDLPGHGNSKLEIENPTIIEISREVQKTLNDLSVTDFDIIGHSLGGYVAIELHKLTNSKGKVCLFHSNFWEDEEQKKLDRNRVIEIVKQNKDFFIKEAIPNLFLEGFQKSDFVANLVQEALKIQVQAIVFHTIAMRDRLSNENYVLNNKHNFLIVQGQVDKIVPYEKMKKHLKTLNIRLVKSAGHMGHIENTKEIIKFLKEF